MSEQVRYELFFWEMMHVLRDAPGPLTPDQVMDAVRARVRPTATENYVDRRGRPRWELGLRFGAGDAATVGWMTKRGGWAIVESGIEALDSFPTPDELHAELRRRYREIDQRRKQAQEMLSDVEQFIMQALGVVEPGRWTAWDDLAELVGVTPDEAGHFLASGKIQIPNAYRVLTVDAGIPDEGMLNASYGAPTCAGVLLRRACSSTRPAVQPGSSALLPKSSRSFSKLVGLPKLGAILRNPRNVHGWSAAPTLTATTSSPTGCATATSSSTTM